MMQTNTVVIRVGGYSRKALPGVRVGKRIVIRAAGTTFIMVRDALGWCVYVNGYRRYNALSADSVRMVFIQRATYSATGCVANVGGARIADVGVR